MTQLPVLFLIGDIPSGDFLLFQSKSLEYGIEVRAIGDSVDPSRDGVPLAYISYLEADVATLLDLFATMPLGAGDEIPLFQRIPTDVVPDFARDLPIAAFFTSPLSASTCWNLITRIEFHRRTQKKSVELFEQLALYRKQKHQLLTIGVALSQQTDLSSLLMLILSETRDIVGADAGSIYLREQQSAGGPFTDRIRFKITQNDSVAQTAMPVEFSIPINEKSIAGYVAATSRSLTIDDVYQINPNLPYQFGKDHEKKFGYRIKSMLTVPLLNTDNQIVGVLQLMNKKTEDVQLTSAAIVENAVVSFNQTDEEFVRAIASQAAVSIERVALHESIQMIFEGFLSSSIAAIDERDRVTSGHSKRVMGYAMAFANAINDADSGPFATEHFSEKRKRQFKFAALLHDIGKIGVPEALLTKDQKLSVDAMESLRMRFEYVRLCFLIPEYQQTISWSCRAELLADWEFLDTINRGGFLSDDNLNRLQAVRAKQYRTPDGDLRPILSDQEFTGFSIRKGNLTADEREQINSHAASTRRILSKIGWIEPLKQIPEIACHHHEKLDGSGYPDHLVADAILLESKILAAVDIYEALVAQDRPYKRVIPSDKAIAILREEVTNNHLDNDIVEFFVARGIYKIFQSELPVPA